MVDVPAGKKTLQIGALGATESVNDPSFEDKAPEPNDASAYRAGKAAIYTSLASEATSGKTSLLVGSKAHQAYVPVRLPTDISSKNTYRVVFDYKNLHGKAAAYSIVTTAKGGKPVYDYKTLAKSDGWIQEKKTITVDPQTSVSLYLYSDSSDGSTTENLYDSVRFYKVAPLQSFPITIKKYDAYYPISNYTTPPRFGSNLLANPSFEDNPLWGRARELYPDESRTAPVARASSDASAGKQSVELTAPGSPAYITERVGIDPAYRTYYLSFDYKNVSGSDAKVNLTQSGKPLLADTVKHSGQWATYSAYFTANNADPVTLQLYSPSSGEVTVNRFDNAIIEPAINVDNFLAARSETAETPQNLVAGYHRLSPVRVNVALKKGSGMVVFNESFHTSWHARLQVKGDASRSLLLPESRHVVANTFSNGWFIEASDFPAAHKGQQYELVLEFAPHKRFTFALIISSVTFISTLFYLARDYLIRKRTGASRV